MDMETFVHPSAGLDWSSVGHHRSQFHPRAAGADRPVWALGNDDYHAKPRATPRFDRPRTVLLLDERSKPAVRSALREGRSYVQYDGEGDGSAPEIERIDAGDGKVTVRTPDARRIEWVAGGERVHAGETITTDRVRGERYTQPFFVN
jgi:hypothetical protein